MGNLFFKQPVWTGLIQYGGTCVWKCTRFSTSAALLFLFFIEILFMSRLCKLYVDYFESERREAFNFSPFSFERLPFWIFRLRVGRYSTDNIFLFSNVNVGYSPSICDIFLLWHSWNIWICWGNSVQCLFFEYFCRFVCGYCMPVLFSMVFFFIYRASL